MTTKTSIIKEPKRTYNNCRLRLSIKEHEGRLRVTGKRNCDPSCSILKTCPVFKIASQLGLDVDNGKIGGAR